MKNVKTAEAFSRLVDFCTGYGGTYNPGRQTLHVESLVAQLSQARKALEEVINAKVQYDKTVNKRKQEFDQLPMLASSILRTLEASGAIPESLADARTFVQRIAGSSPKSSKPVEGEVAPIQRSKLMLAYVSKAESFEMLVKTVVGEPLYQSNEAHLSAAGLEEKVKELQWLNSEVSNTRVAWSNARIARDNALYDQKNSLLQTARAVKRYIRAIFGPASAQFAQVKSLSFTKPGKS